MSALGVSWHARLNSLDSRHVHRAWARQRAVWLCLAADLPSHHAVILRSLYIALPDTMLPLQIGISGQLDAKDLNKAPKLGGFIDVQH